MPVNILESASFVLSDETFNAGTFLKKSLNMLYPSPQQPRHELQKPVKWFTQQWFVGNFVHRSVQYSVQWTALVVIYIVLIIR